MIKLRNLVLALAALAFVAPVVDGAYAQEKSAKTQKVRKKTGGGLAGSEGTVKRKIMFLSDQEGGCKALYQRYVGMSGHSAYAATAVDYFYGGSFVCAAGLNVGSQAEAERRALAQCNDARRQYKAKDQSMQLTGNCMIYASK